MVDDFPAIFWLPEGITNQKWKDDGDMMGVFPCIFNGLSWMAAIARDVTSTSINYVVYWFSPKISVNNGDKGFSSMHTMGIWYDRQYIGYYHECINIYICIIVGYEHVL